MNRRDFAKTTATGLGGLLAMLVPGKVLAKVKPKPEFPRYFVPADVSDWGRLPVLYVAESSDCVVQRCPDYDIRLEA